MSEASPVRGLHHVTTYARHPQETLDYFAGLLGLRLVKQTVNFDDPTTYHLYYGDARGRPGTILTCFPWVQIGSRRPGIREVSEVIWAVPEGALGYWQERLGQAGIDAELDTASAAPRLSFEAPIGGRFALVEDPTLQAEVPSQELSGWQSPVPEAFALRHCAGVRARVPDAEPYKTLLEDTFGWESCPLAEDLHRWQSPSPLGTQWIEVEVEPHGPLARPGTGSVHHIALRVPDEAALAEQQQRLEGEGWRPTPIIDRQYFKSVYFREPNGILFELATDPPGFTRDEPLETLGQRLQLPEHLEAQRQQISDTLPPLST